MLAPSSSFKPIQRSLSLKLVGLAFGIIVIFTCILTVFDLWSRYENHHSDLTWILQEVVGSHHESLGSAIWNFDDPKIIEKLESFLSVRDVNHVQLKTNESRQLIEKGNMPDNVVFRTEFPIHHVSHPGANPIHVGTLIFSSDMRDSQRALIDRLLITLGQEFVISVFIAAFLFFSVNTLLLQPLSQISRFLAEFDTDKRIPDLKISRFPSHSGYDELDSLVDHINSLKQRTQMSHWALKDMNFSLEAFVEERTKVILDQKQRLESSAHWSALGEMAGSIAHEINNPLAIIMGKSQLLLRKPLSDDVRVSLMSIVKTTQRIADVVQSLRILSRDASGDPFEYFSLGKIMKDTVDLTTEKLRQKEIELTLAPGFECYEISCRHVQVSQALINLINNSADALEGVTGPRQITIEASERGGFLVVSVLDSGPGFPMEIREKVSTPFFTTKEIGKGTGLGLSLSRSIMSSHGGEFEIDFNAPLTTVRLKFKNFRRQLKRRPEFSEDQVPVARS